MRKLSLREVKGLAQGHTAGEGRSWDPSPNLPYPTMVSPARAQSERLVSIWVSQ